MEICVNYQIYFYVNLIKIPNILLKEYNCFKITIDEYMKLPYRMEIIPDTEEGGYVVSFPELPGCLTCADTLEQAAVNGEAAKREWLIAAMEEGIEIPEPVSLDDYSGQFKLRIPKSLHHALAAHAKEEGISMNQYCVYLLTKNDTLSHA